MTANKDETTKVAQAFLMGWFNHLDAEKEKKEKQKEHKDDNLAQTNLFTKEGR